MSANGGWPRLPLEAMSDIELLSIFEDAADEEDGGATSIDVAERTDEGVKAARSIGQRFSWLARWGYMERDERTKRWYLTPEGLRLREGTRLTARERQTLERLANSPLAVGDTLGSRLSRDDLRMVRRQVRYQEVHRR